MITIESPRLLDIAILEMNAALLANLTWLNNAFGKAETKTEIINGNQISYPGLFIGKNEYRKLLPDDKLGNYCFIQVNDSQDLNIQQRISAQIETDISIIFWFDYRKYYPSNPEGVTIENVKHSILNFLIKYTSKTYTFDVTSIDEGADSVFSGYTPNELMNQFNMRPYGCLRFNGEIRTKRHCDFTNIPVTTLPTGSLVEVYNISNEFKGYLIELNA